MTKSERIREVEQKTSWLEGAAEQSEKRLEVMEKLYLSIDRKLWAIILLAVGSIVASLIKP